MSAEEMRNDLETFVNQGLSQGWCGWPKKGFVPSPARSITVGAYSRSATPILGYRYPRSGAVAGWDGQENIGLLN